MISPRTIRQLRLLTTLLVAAGAEAQIGVGPPQQEDDLRAALILGFARFTEWPVELEGPIVIGVLGRPGISTALERVSAGKIVNGRSVVIRHLRNPGQAAGCHILYFGRLPGQRVPEVMAEARGLDVKTPVLAIGEEDRFLSDGGAVQLFEEDGRMSFEVNLRSLQRANLSISSKLLRLGYTSGVSRRGRGTP
ncbi:MAG: YfiR family protein [Bryobacteraceae bacterium]